MKRQLALRLALCTALAVAPFNAFAVTQSVTANIAFDTPLSITKNADINFGTVKALTASTYTIDTTGGTPTATGSGAYLYGAHNAADLTIIGSTTQTVDISVGGYTANANVTPSNATCNYNGGGAGTCALTAVAAPGAGKTLLIGVDATATAVPAAGATAAPTFTVTVVYS